jgi:large subunit ribosomal protein L5
MNRVRTAYKEQVVPALYKQFGYKNIHQVPKLEKIVLSMGGARPFRTR